MLNYNKLSISGLSMKKFQQNIANQRDRLQSEVAVLNQQASSLRYGIQQMNGISHNSRRDIYEVYGYPRSLAGTEGFRMMYELAGRMGMATRLTWGMAKSCWREGFNIKQDNEEDADSIEEDFLNSLNKQGLNAALERADILNRIGRFSALFVGVPDGLQTTEEIGTVSGDKLDQVYFKVFAYDGIIINKINNDNTSPRFGLPELYEVQNITTNSDREKDYETISMIVHWSRIVLLNERGLVSDIEGQGYLEPVYNRLLDIQKATGGSAEAYFRNSRRIITNEIDPNFAASLDDTAKQAINTATEKFTNGWQDQIVTAGSKVSQLQASHADPSGTVKTAIWEVASYTGYPIRILTGEGAGQLAGSEDQLTYNALVSDRQTIFCAKTVVDLLKIFESAGMVTLPDTYVIDFPLQAAVSETQEVENNNKRADTLQKLSQAMQTPGLDIDTKTALATVGLSDIKIDTFDDLNKEDENV